MDVDSLSLLGPITVLKLKFEPRDYGRRIVAAGSGKQMLNHPLTTSGAEKFRADWESRPEFGEWLRNLTEQRAAAR